MSDDSGKVLNIRNPLTLIRHARTKLSVQYDKLQRKSNGDTQDVIHELHLARSIIAEAIIQLVQLEGK